MAGGRADGAGERAARAGGRGTRGAGPQRGPGGIVKRMLLGRGAGSAGRGESPAGGRG